MKKDIQQLIPYFPNQTKIISIKPFKGKYIFHGSNKKYSILKPEYNGTYGNSESYELGIPVIFGSVKPSDAFCKKPTKQYQELRNKLKDSIYYRLTSKGRKLLLGHTFGGYIYVCNGGDFVEIVREDFENKKWTRSKEWLALNPVKPIDIIKIEKSFDWECIPEYQFIGAEHVGSLPVKEYLKYCSDKKVIQAIQEKLLEQFKPVFPKQLKKYI